MTLDARLAEAAEKEVGVRAELMVRRLAFARGLSRKSNLGKSTNVRSKHAAKKMAPAVAFLTPVIMAGYINQAGTLASVKLYFVLAPERRLPPDQTPRPPVHCGPLRTTANQGTTANQVGLD